MFRLQRVGSHGSISCPKLRHLNDYGPQGEWASWPGGFVLITEGSGMGNIYFVPNK